MSDKAGDRYICVEVQDVVVIRSAGKRRDFHGAKGASLPQGMINCVAGPPQIVQVQICDADLHRSV